jgi:hypothetical protein
MWFKGHGGHSTGRTCDFPRAGEQRLMAQVNAVEVSDRDAAQGG